MKIVFTETGVPQAKLAEAELHFEEGPLDGLRLIGFGVWERRPGNGRNVTFPARQYTVSGEHRSFALLRPNAGTLEAHDRLKDLILEAYATYEAIRDGATNIVRDYNPEAGDRIVP